MRRTRRMVAAAILVGGAGALLAAAPAGAREIPVHLHGEFGGGLSAEGPGQMVLGNVPPSGTSTFDQLVGPFGLQAQLDDTVIADDFRGSGLFDKVGEAGAKQRLGRTYRYSAQLQGQGVFTQFPGAAPGVPAPGPVPGPVTGVQRSNQVVAAAAIVRLGQTVFQPRLVDSPVPNAPTQVDRNALRFSHFKCYAVVGRAPGFRARTVKLTDQFGEYTRVRLLRPVELCNPVIKRHRNRNTPITDTRRHLVVFQARRIVAESHDLTTRNQFGTQRIKNGNLTRVLVPSTKRLVRGPGRSLRRRTSSRVLDHFTCYPAGLQAGRPTGRVQLTDQFERKQHPLTVLNGVCNPAQKVHGGRTTRVRNEDSHLVSIGLRNTSSRLRGVVVRNQFGVQGLVTRRATRLLVPSTKRVCATWSATTNAPVTTLAGQQVGSLTKISFTPYGNDPNGACPAVTR